jgi:hypothetical protein
MSKYTEVKCYWKPLFFKDKRHTIIDYKLLLNTVQVQEQVTPKMITGNSFAPSFLETPHTCLQYNTWKLK